MANQQYDNTNRFVLFPNSRKTKQSHPDYTGKIDIAGTEHWLSAWIKDGKKGQFLSGSIGDVIEDKPAAAPGSFPGQASIPVTPEGKPATDQKMRDDFDDDIPF